MNPHDRLSLYRAARKSLPRLSEDQLVSMRKQEAEGGCGVVGLMASEAVAGKHLHVPSLQMQNRGNGKGGGIAAVGLVPEQMGVPEYVLERDYILQVAYLDPAARADVEWGSVFRDFEVDHLQPVPVLDDYRDAGLEVKPPDVVRYFVRPRADALERFVAEKELSLLPQDQVEDEFVFQSSYQLNGKYYASLGDKRAFVMSHAKNLLVFKLVGYAEQAIDYYRLHDLRAHGWIAHQRYPTKGRVWHPGGAHPFIGMHEALVHNGDFANYFGVCEVLKQHGLHPQFLTDTEVSVLLFDLLSRTFEYPLEWVIEAMAPTTERDFLQLPEERRRIYKMLQLAHLNGSPDGPWFFIIARNDVKKRNFQLLGITDTSMLRPQVFALHEGEVQIGVIASEKQAIDAALESIASEDRRVCPVADRYWNARGGSYTDGGAFLFSVDYSNGRTLSASNKFEDPVHLYSDQNHPAASAAGRDARLTTERRHPAGNAGPPASSRLLPDAGLERLTRLLDLPGEMPAADRKWHRAQVQAAIDEWLDSAPWTRLTVETRARLQPPVDERDRLVVDARGFAPEGPGSLSLFVVEACSIGWREIILYRLRGHRFIGCGLHEKSHHVRIHVYGSSGDYLASGLDGAEVVVHGNGQDQLGQIFHRGHLVVYGDVGQTFFYGAKGGRAFVLGNAAGRPLINAVGTPRVVINGTCLDYLAESFMAGDPLHGGGFVILNGVCREGGGVVELPTPYPGSNLFSLASGGAIYVRDPRRLLDAEQLNGGEFAELSDEDWRLIHPYLEENERLFEIRVEADLLCGASPADVYRKIRPAKSGALH